jgi:hypothetical protein
MTLKTETILNYMTEQMALYANVSIEKIKTRRGKQPLPDLRKAIIHIAFYDKRISLYKTQIADYFDFNHASIIHSLEKSNNLIDTNHKPFLDVLNYLKVKVNLLLGFSEYMFKGIERPSLDHVKFGILGISSF